ncbi:MAG TPA: phytanoyl-CoA dioxygenase family protein [Acidimicrobiales bacterium]|nr:phytanoyl-CoA dioxygenase family protein [Acidimicrobiales bacterium]
MDHFAEHGWVRIPGAFTADDAAAMRDVTWRALESVGIRRADPSTWTKHRPDHLQHLKADPVFRAVGSVRTRAAIDEVLGGQPWAEPRDWGAFFLVFPTPGRPWSPPTSTWHLDAPYTDPLAPPAGVKVHAMYGDVAPGAGAMCILDGSHRVVHRWFVDNPQPAGTPAAKLRKALLRDAGVLDLPVVENTAQAGDVIFMHPLLLHAPPTAHTGTQPRFLLNKDLRI